MSRSRVRVKWSQRQRIRLLIAMQASNLVAEHGVELRDRGNSRRHRKSC